MSFYSVIIHPLFEFVKKKMRISFNNVVFDSDDVIDLLTHSETTCMDCNRDDCPFQALWSGDGSCEAGNFALYTILELFKVIDRKDDAIFAMVDQIVDLRTNLQIFKER